MKIEAKEVVFTKKVIRSDPESRFDDWEEDEEVTLSEWMNQVEKRLEKLESN